MKRYLTIFLLLPLFCFGQRQLNQKLPVNTAMIWQDNNGNPYSEGALIDGVLTAAFAPDNNVARDTHDVWVNLPPQWNTKITKVRWYDINGSNPDNPTYYYGVKRYGGAWVLLATFTGSSYNSWVETLVNDTSTFDYLLIRNNSVQAGGDLWPAEVEWYGDYNPYTPIFLKPKLDSVPFQQHTGANGYWYWWQKPADYPNINPSYANRWSKLKNARIFHNWQQSVKRYTDSTRFNGLDTMLRQMKQRGMYVMVSVQTLPEKFIYQYYPNNPEMWPPYNNSGDTSQGRQLNVLTPAPYGSDLEDPNNYRGKADFLFQMAARYGKNTATPPVDKRARVMRYNWEVADSDRWGLNLIDELQVGNEDDKDWMKKQRQFHVRGSEAMAMMSACYDGHMGTMGAGVGIKVADPTMKVTLIGLARMVNSDWLMSAKRWVDKYRNGNWPFDVFDWHKYSSDAGTQGASTRGVAPELSGWVSIIDTVQNFLANNANNMPSSISEFGFDTRNTIQRAIAVGTLTQEKNQANLLLRSAFLAQGKRVSRIYAYELGDNDLNPANLTQYYSSGMMWDSTQSESGGVTRNKHSLNLFVQARALLNDWYADSMWVNSDSVWFVREKKGDSTAYAVWLGTERDGSKTVTIPATTGYRYDLNYTTENYTATPFAGGSNYSFTVSEKPAVFKVTSGSVPEGEVPLKVKRFAKAVVN